MEASRTPIIFVVGASRTGTTAVARMLQASGQVWMAREMHFFERLCPDRLLNKPMRDSRRERVWRALVRTQTFGIMDEQRSHAPVGLTGIPPRAPEELSPMDVYAAFMRHGAKGRIPCDHTPRNIYYLKEILEKWPEARVIIMLRDPRDVLLSQKSKWKRIRHDGVTMSRREAIRLWVNYHPITTSWLWRSSVAAAVEWKTHPRVLICPFEDLVCDPATWAQRISTHVGIAFHENMLNVPRRGSSHGPNHPNAKGFDPARAQHWKKSGGLSPSELWWCERICKRFMPMGHYDTMASGAGLLLAPWHALTWPFKLLASACLNQSRIANVKDFVFWCARQG